MLLIDLNQKKQKKEKQIEPKWCLMLLIDLNKKYQKKEKTRLAQMVPDVTNWPQPKAPILAKKGKCPIIATF